MGAVFPYITSFFAIICYALLPVIAKKMSVSVPPFSFIAITMFILAGLAMCASFLMERDFKFAALKLGDVSWIALFGVINFIGLACIFSL